MPLTKTNVSKKVAENAEVKEKTTAAVSAETPITAKVPENLGSLSDKLAFIGCLGDPSRDDITPASADGKQPKRVDPTIVGYRFKALVDIEVPDVQPGEDYKGLKNPMSYEGNPLNTRPVKAGETFDLTRFETGVLVSRDEINAKITGGDFPVVATYTIQKKKNATGGIVAASTAIPTVSLRGIDGKSVKDVPFINVLSYEKQTTGTRKDKDGKDVPTFKKIRTILPGFEKWQKLCEDSVRATGTGSSSSATAANKRNAGAQAFMNILNKRAQSGQ